MGSQSLPLLGLTTMDGLSCVPVTLASTQDWTSERAVEVERREAQHESPGLLATLKTRHGAPGLSNQIGTPCRVVSENTTFRRRHQDDVVSLILWVFTRQVVEQNRAVRRFGWNFSPHWWHFTYSGVWIKPFRTL